jgi:hypothetical protein
MGFIKTDYEIDNMGITLPKAYAQITRLSVNIDGSATAIFAIQKDRESIVEKEHIDTISFRCNIDKDLPVYKQVYEKAKEEIFTTWENDIVEE